MTLQGPLQGHWEGQSREEASWMAVGAQALQPAWLCFSDLYDLGQASLLCTSVSSSVKQMTLLQYNRQREVNVSST